MKWRDLLKKVKTDHIIEAMNEIKNGKLKVPPHRRAKRWCIKYEGRLYPTKYVLARAVQIATGEPFPTDARTGGKPTLGALREVVRGDTRFELIDSIIGSNATED